MGVPSTCSSRTKTARPLASWPVITVRTFIPCLFSSGLIMATFLDTCDFDFIRLSLHVSSTLYSEAQAPTAEIAVTPPSIKKSAPTTYAESSDAR